MMSNLKLKPLTVGLAMFILIVVIFFGWLLLRDQQVFSTFYLVPKNLIQSATELSQQYNDSKSRFTLNYPTGWAARTDNDLTKSPAGSISQKISRLMIASFDYPLNCAPNNNSLEECAGVKLPTGAFVDINIDNYQSATSGQMINAERGIQPDPAAIEDSPIKINGATVYAWNNLSCGPRCYVLRALFIPLREHQMMKIFANAYLGEEIKPAEIQPTLTRYQEILDAMMASIKIE